MLFFSKIIERKIIKLVSVSFKLRFSILAIIVIFGLTMNYLLVQDSLKMIDEVRNDSNIYQENDLKISKGINEFDTTIYNFLANELELLLVHYIFAPDINIEDTNFDLVYRSLEISPQELTDLLADRDSSNYSINVEPVGVYNYIGFNETLLNATNNIITKEDGKNVYQNYVEMSTLVETAFQNFDKVASDLRKQHNEASQTFFNNAEQIGNTNSGYYGNITSEYNKTRFNLIASANDTYNFDMMLKYESLYSSVTDIISAWAAAEITGFGVNETNPDFISDVIANFHTTIFDAEDKFNESSFAITTTSNLRQEELDTFNAINYTVMNELLPAIHSIAFAMDDLYAISLDLHSLLKDDLTPLLDEFSRYSSLIKTFFGEEQRNFANALEDIFNQFDRNISDRLISGIIFTSLLIISILMVTIITMLLNFRKLESKFKLVAKGNLDLNISMKYANTEFGSLEHNFDEVVQQLRGALSTIRITSERLSGIAEELAAGSEEASASIREVSDTMREFSGGASEQNIMLSRVTEKLQEHLDDVDRSNARIGETSKFVLKVAKRTNILGLNASIEAAKAGRYGRGFNVVAEEVRDLSETTKGSANQIAEIIDDVQHSISRAVEDILREVNIVKEVAENTAAGSEEVSAATLEQVTMLDEISETSAELAHLSQDMNNLIQKFII